jgi:uncharacterized membrane protein YhaH (DUF805 family)
MSLTTAPLETTLDAPRYGASFGEAVSRGFRKYATFSGRASRSEYWWWMLMHAMVVTVLYIVLIAGGFIGATVDADGETMPGPMFGVGAVLFLIWELGTIVPILALCWRRLHDTNHSGAFYFLAFVPIVGGIIYLVFTLLPADPAGARFDR